MQGSKILANLQIGISLNLSFIHQLRNHQAFVLLGEVMGRGGVVSSSFLHGGESIVFAYWAFLVKQPFIGTVPTGHMFGIGASGIITVRTIEQAEQAHLLVLFFLLEGGLVEFAQRLLSHLLLGSYLVKHKTTQIIIIVFQAESMHIIMATLYWLKSWEQASIDQQQQIGGLLVLNYSDLLLIMLNIQVPTQYSPNCWLRSRQTKSTDRFECVQLSPSSEGFLLGSQQSISLKSCPPLFSK